MIAFAAMMKGKRNALLTILLAMQGFGLSLARDAFAGSGSDIRYGRRESFSGIPANYLFNHGSDAGAGARAQRVVQVSSELKGSGVLILVGSEPMVLTASHLLKGRKSAEIFLPARGFTVAKIATGAPTLQSWTLQVRGQGTVVRDYPAYDFALLRLPADLLDRDREALAHYASLNAQICPLGLDECTKELNWSSDIALAGNRVDGLINGVGISTDVENGFQASPEADYYVSGLLRWVRLVPSFT